MRSLAGTVALGVTVLAACANPSGPDPTPSPEPSARDIAAVAIAEAVHRVQFIEFLREPQWAGPKTYCLTKTSESDSLRGSIDSWTDPPEALLQRFADHQPPVKRLSVCQVDFFTGVTDLETGWRAVLFRASSPAWESDTEVVVYGGYTYSSRGAVGNKYRVRFDGARWVVVDVETGWIA